MLIFCEIALGWMSIIWSQYWQWLGTDRQRFKYSMEYFRWIPTKWSKMYWTTVKISWLFYFPPSAVYMRRWIGSALIRVMVSRLFGAKPLPEPVLNYNQLDPRELQWNWNWNSNTFIEDRFENVVCNFHIINGILFSYLICIWSGDV